MTRRIYWNENDYVHTRPDGMEACAEGEDCIELRDQWGDEFVRTVNMPFTAWVWLAESILSERDRRETEAAKQPKRFIAWKPRPDSDWRVGPSAHSAAQPLEVFADGSLRCLYLTAKNEKDAFAKAREADLTFGVFAREYLA